MLLCHVWVSSHSGMNSCCDWQHCTYDPDQSKFIDHQVGRTRWTRKVYVHIILTVIKHQEGRRKRSVLVWALWHAKLLVRVWNVLEATSLFFTYVTPHVCLSFLMLTIRPDNGNLSAMTRSRDYRPDFVYSDPANSKMLLAELTISNFSWKHLNMCFKQMRKHKNNMKNLLCQGKVYSEIWKRVTMINTNLFSALRMCRCNANTLKGSFLT